MVDRISRDVGATLLRDLIDGQITNDEFMSKFKFPKNTDQALRAILVFAWGQFSDLHVHKLTGHHAPTPERLAFLERCVLFLRTNLEFEWPVPKPSLRKRLLEMLGSRQVFHRSESEYMSKGDFEVWPFFRRSDYEAAGTKIEIRS
jgi:hypothetical protein